ncbi:hypothetical protein ACLK2D_21200 [Escherichia coli]
MRRLAPANIFPGDMLFQTLASPVTGASGVL